MWEQLRHALLRDFRESHGPAYGGVVDGCPPGLALSADDIQKEWTGKTRLVAPRHAAARVRRVEILSGVYEGRTTGTGSLIVRNEDSRSKDYGAIAEKFRPGHADYTTAEYGIRDGRGGGRASARETLVRSRRLRSRRSGCTSAMSHGARLSGATRGAEISSRAGIRSMRIFSSPRPAVVPSSRHS